MTRGVIAAVEVVVLLGGAVLAGWMAQQEEKSANGEAPDPRNEEATAEPENGSSPEMVPFIMMEQDVKIHVEAEALELLPPMTVEQANAASGGKYVTVPEGPAKKMKEPALRSTDGRRIAHDKNGHNVWMDNGEPVGDDVKVEPNGMGIHRFELEKAGKYHLWARHYWPHSCADSFNFWIGPEAEFKTRTDAAGYTWLPQEWRTFAGASGGNWNWGRPANVNDRLALEAGPQVLVICNKEDGMRVDRFLITDIPADEWKPAGKEGQ